MPLAFARSGDANAARAAVPGSISGGWFRLPEATGTSLVWAEFGRPAPGYVTIWRSRQSAESGEYGSARVMTEDAFAQAVSEPSTSRAPDRVTAVMLEQVLGAVRTLSERFDRHEATSAVPPNVRLLEVIADTTVATSFTVRELLAYGRRYAPIVLLAAAQACDGEINGRSLGWKLAHIAEAPPAGFTVVRLGSERDGLIWKVVRRQSV